MVDLFVNDCVKLKLLNFFINKIDNTNVFFTISNKKVSILIIINTNEVFAAEVLL